MFTKTGFRATRLNVPFPFHSLNVYQSLGFSAEKVLPREGQARARPGWREARMSASVTEKSEVSRLEATLYFCKRQKRKYNELRCLVRLFKEVGR